VRQDVTPEVCQWRLVVEGVPLRDDYVALIKGLTCYKTIDGASQLSIDANALDPETMEYRIINEAILWPGRKVELFLGYGASATFPMGRFKIKTHLPKYRPDGVTVQIEAFDALADMMDEQARLIQGAQSHADVIVDVMERFYPSMGYIVAQGTKKAGDRFKEAGVTDLAWLKNMAIADGFAYPQVWTREQYEIARELLRERLGDDGLDALGEVETKVRDDMLVYLPNASVYAFSDVLRLWYDPKGVSDLTTFDPTFSVQDVPTAVEAYGTVIEGGEPKIKKVVIEFEQGGPRISDVTDEWETDWTRDQKIREQIKSGTAVKLYTLGDSTTSYETGQTAQVKNAAGKTATIRSKRLDREVLNGDGVLIPTTDDLLTFAKRWMLQRASAFLVGEATMSNRIGSERLAPNQIHEIAGCADPHAGLWALKTVTHQVSGGGHDVTVTTQKLVTEADVYGGQDGPKTKVEEA